jgi:pimeloyl-[acyl-carrier protein] methyl ester esterase
MSAGITVVMLPGMDGTGRLFEPLMRELPPGLLPVVVNYPADRPLGYAELAPLVEAAIPVAGPFAVLAESFSGPLALRLAARGHPRLVAIVLVASFVRAPIAGWLSPLRCLVGSWCFRFPISAWGIRRYLAGADTSDDLVASIQSAIATVAPRVLAKRLREVLQFDDRRELHLIRIPVLSISGGGDRLVSRRCAADIAALGDLVEAVVLDAPHLVLQRQPVATARVIDEFLRRTLGRK